MNTRSVSIRAGRRSGMAITLFALLVALRPARGAEVAITVTGTVNGVVDYMHIFGKAPTIAAGTPFTLVFTFDDAKGRSIMPGQCTQGGTGIAGAGQGSPGTAVLTIADKSYEFGRRPGARSSAWRAISTGCSESGIAVLIMEGQAPFESKVGIKLAPTGSTRSLTQDVNWKSPVTLKEFYAANGMNGFMITRQNNYGGGTFGYLSISQVTIGGVKQASR